MYRRKTVEDTNYKKLKDTNYLNLKPNIAGIKNHRILKIKNTC